MLYEKNKSPTSFAVLQFCLCQPIGGTSVDPITSKFTPFGGCLCDAARCTFSKPLSRYELINHEEFIKEMAIGTKTAFYSCFVVEFLYLVSFATMNLFIHVPINDSHIYYTITCSCLRLAPFQHVKRHHVIVLYLRRHKGFRVLSKFIVTFCRLKQQRSGSCSKYGIWV